MTIVFFPSSIGLADNNDFLRATKPFGISAVSNEKYLNFESDYIIENPKETIEYFYDLFKKTNNEKDEFYSTQFIFTKTSLVFNSMYNKIRNFKADNYDIRILGILYIFIYSMAVTILLFYIKSKNIYLTHFLRISTVFILMDSAYLVYMNSFYGEATTLIFFVLSIALIIKWINSKITYLDIFLLMISIIIFSGSKAANLPSAILLIVFIVINIIKNKDKKRIILTIISSVIAIVLMISVYLSIPVWMDKVTTYQSVFFGVLKDNNDAASALEELELPKELVILANTHGYMKNDRYDLYNEEFEELFFNRISKVSILTYYLKHPRFLHSKLDILAESSIAIKPTYLGNYRYEDTNKRLGFTSRFNIWESIRKMKSGKALINITLILFLYIFLILLKIIRKKRKWKFIFFDIVLLVNVIGQFIVPLIGNGEADIMKHMFLFNLSFDLMLIFLLKNIFDLVYEVHKKIDYKKTFTLISKFKYYILAMIILVSGLVLVLNVLRDDSYEVGNLISFGEYEGKKIDWVILYKESNEITLISKNPIINMSFDKKDEFGSNQFKESSIKEWLNTEFINSFTIDEREKLLIQDYKTVLSYNNIEKNVDGSKPHFWFSMIAYADSNYNTAYYENDFSLVTIPSVMDIKEYYNTINKNIKKNDSYWLRTPYYSRNSFVRYVDKDGLIYHSDAINNELGVIPMIKIIVDEK